MAIICKSCSKQLYKDDGSGPYCCPSCVNRRIEAVDSETNELVQLNVSKGRKSVTPKGRDGVHLGLLKNSRFAVTVPHRGEPVKMLRLKSRQFKNTTVPVGPVYVRFDQNGIGEVEAHNKQFIDPVIQARPGRFSWLESATEHLVSTLADLNALKPVEAFVPPPVPEKVVEAKVVAEEAKAARAELKKPKKITKKVEE